MLFHSNVIFSKVISSFPYNVNEKSSQSGGHCLCGVGTVLSMSAWVFTQDSLSFLPHPKDVHVRSTGISKLCG